MPDRLIVFDIGNVLLQFDTRIAARAFDRLDPGKGRPLAEALWSPGLMNRFETGKISGRKVFEIVRKKFDLTMGYAGFHRAFTDIFEPIAENVHLFRRIARKRTVALLSNVNDLHWTYIHRRYPVLKRAHLPFASFKLGVMKPSPRAYRAVAERAGFSLRKMVYVDDREDFILAARRLGVTALHYTGRRKLAAQFREVGIVP